MDLKTYMLRRRAPPLTGVLTQIDNKQRHGNYTVSQKNDADVAVAHYNFIAHFC